MNKLQVFFMCKPDIPIKTRYIPSGFRYPPAKPPNSWERFVIRAFTSFHEEDPFIRRTPLNVRLMFEWFYTWKLVVGASRVKATPLQRLVDRKVWKGKLGYQYHVFSLRKQVYCYQTRAQALEQKRIVFSNWLFGRRARRLALRWHKAMDDDFKRLESGEDPGGWPEPRHRWERAMYYIIIPPFLKLWRANKIYWQCFWAWKLRSMLKWVSLACILCSYKFSDETHPWEDTYAFLFPRFERYYLSKSGKLNRLRYQRFKLPTNAELQRYLARRQLSYSLRNRYLYAREDIGCRVRFQTFYPQPPSLVELLISGYFLRFSIALGCIGLVFYIMANGFFYEGVVLFISHRFGLSPFRAWVDYLVVCTEIFFRSVPGLLWYAFRRHVRYSKYDHPRRPCWWRLRIPRYADPDDYDYDGKVPDREHWSQTGPWQLRLFLGELWTLASFGSPRRKARNISHLQPPVTLGFLLTFFFFIPTLAFLFPWFRDHLFNLLVFFLLTLRPPPF